MTVRLNKVKGIVGLELTNVNLTSNTLGIELYIPPKVTFSSAKTDAVGWSNLEQSKNKVGSLFLSTSQNTFPLSVDLPTFETTSKTYTSLQLTCGIEKAIGSYQTTPPNNNSLLLSSGSYNDKKPITFNSFNTNLSASSQKAIKKKDLSDLTISAPPIETVKDVMLNSFGKIMFNASFRSLYGVKEINLAGQAFIDNVFVVIDQEFENIIAKTSMDTGTFLRPIQTEGDKVHVIAVPADVAKNIISFRNIDISSIN